MSVIHNLVDWAPLGLPSFLFVITIVVFFHELGHFSVARACGVKIETFSIGFGPAIFSWLDSKGTRWKVSWIPLGGFVKFLGDADAMGTPDREKTENLSGSERSQAFPFKPIHQRAAIVAAGPIANFVLAVGIFAIGFLIVGRTVQFPLVETVTPGSAAEQAGMKAGDIIRAVDGEPINDFSELQQATFASGGRTLAIKLERDGRPMTLAVAPRLTTRPDPTGGTAKIYVLGISIDVPPVIASVAHGSQAERLGLKPQDVIVAVGSEKVLGFEQFAGLVAAQAGKNVAITVRRDGRNFEVHAKADSNISVGSSGRDETYSILGARSLGHPRPVTIHYHPISAVGAGAKQTWLIASGTLGYVWQMFSGHADTSQLGGPIRVGIIAGKVANLGLLPLIQLAGILSVSIGLINLFPIPLLDGGHLLYYGCEAVLGRPLRERTQDIGFRLGLAVVLSLMILAFWNDLARLNLF